MGLVDRDALNGGAAAIAITYADGRRGYVPALALVSSDGQDVVQRETINLIVANVPVPQQTAYGGDYIWSVVGTFGGASVQLQSLGPDASTWQNLGPAKAAADAGGGSGVGLGSNAVVRAVVTGGAPAGLYASLSRLP